MYCNAENVEIQYCTDHHINIKNVQQLQIDFFDIDIALYCIQYYSKKIITTVI